MGTGRRLPPLQTLAFFEAAGRLLNFSAAARELGVTQSAVSHQIAWLETDLGTTLFRRLHRGVVLTADGTRLFETTREALDAIHAAASAIRTGSGRSVLNVATDFGFAAWWLMPRLSTLRTIMPDLDVRIVTAQSEIDIRREAVDIAIAFGDGRWPGCEAERLFPEIVLPICSPGFKLARRGAGAPRDLLSLPLLHLESIVPANWLTWADWFALHRLPLPSSGHDLTFNNYPLVLQAALMGQGVALGWVPLVDDLIRGGQLVPLLDLPVRTDRGYFIVEYNRGRPDKWRDLFRRWINDESRRGRDQAP
ncbi:MAG TPA: LysR substrate-binding domain-containing protein [Arenibaculum sp.]|nr:LysR substrate-binding domain-containing protein [Arenibaculum sp.]